MPPGRKINSINDVVPSSTHCHRPWMVLSHVRSFHYKLIFAKQSWWHFSWMRGKHICYVNMCSSALQSVVHEIVGFYKFIQSVIRQNLPQIFIMHHLWLHLKITSLNKLNRLKQSDLAQLLSLKVSKSSIIFTMCFKTIQSPLLLWSIVLQSVKA